MHLSDNVMLADIGGFFLLPIALSAFAFWLWIIVDCARHEIGSTMIAWLLAVLFAASSLRHSISSFADSEK